MKTSTDLNVITAHPELFTWGTLIEIHEIGEYTFVEYSDHTSEIRFNIYIAGKDMHNGAISLDRAILRAIALKYDGINTRADGYMVNMLNIEDV